MAFQVYDVDTGKVVWSTGMSRVRDEAERLAEEDDDGLWLDVVESMPAESTIEEQLLAYHAILDGA